MVWLKLLALVTTWYAISAAMGLVAWPLFRRALPESLAWGMSRLFGPYLVAWLAISPAAFLPRAYFTPLSLLLTALGLSALAWAIAHKLSPTTQSDASARFRSWIAFEVFYYGVFLAAGVYVVFNVGVESLGERFWDTSLWTGILAQRVYPLDAPWFPGHVLHYHVFGYYPLAAIASFAGGDSLVGYSLAMALVFTWYAASLFLLFRALRLDAPLAVLGALTVSLGSNAKSLLQALDFLLAGHPYDWWSVSRVIPNTINEFPFWSFTLGDLHPHYLGLPLFGILLALTLGRLERERKLDARLLGPLAGLTIGWLWGANAWETPVAAALVFLVALLTARGEWKQTAIGLALTTATALVIALPFLRIKSHVPIGFGWVGETTAPSDLLRFFGLFFLPLLLLPLFRLARHAARDWALGLACLMLVAYAAGSTRIFLLFFVVLVALGALGRAASLRGERAALLLATLGLMVLGGCELVHFNDVYGEGMPRLNTIFKMYMPAWTLLGSGAFLAVVSLRELFPIGLGKKAMAAWTLTLSAHFFFGAYARTGGFPMPHGIDPLWKLAQVEADDAKLIAWMRAQPMKGPAVVMEAIGDPYSLYARYGSLTGMRSYLGWPNHISIHYPGSPDLAARTTEIRETYAGKVTAIDDCAEPLSRLRKAGVDFVMLGTLERKEGTPSAIAHLEHCLPLVHREGKAALLATR